METDWQALQHCIAAAGTSTQTALKIVVFDDADYEYAREVHGRFPSVGMILQVGTEKTSTRDTNAHDVSGAPAITQRTEWLLQRVSTDQWFDVTILPQLHVLLWGSKRGV
jgi:7-carboxy-7-deazaguanine synthase